jgi:predicted dehydrogenase
MDTRRFTLDLARRRFFMNIAFVGCGFVFDIYMRTIRAHPELVVKGLYDINAERLAQASTYYGFHAYSSYEALLSDKGVDLVVNLTNIGAHYFVCKQALEAGKHVYSEKPLTTDVAQSQELFALARDRRVELYAAPCNIYSDTVRTMFKTVQDGAIGKPLLVYAELDDNPIHVMDFESVRSASGAPWPLKEEIYEGCTFEHVGYHLVWICALLGPAKNVTAFSAELIENKMVGLPPKVGTPDFSVACLNFANGATARVTCSVVAPRDHRMRVIGEAGEVSADSYRQYQSPVRLERFTKGSLSARKFRTLRNSPGLGRWFGIGGRRMPLVKNPHSKAIEGDQQKVSSPRQRLVEALRRREVYAQDKLVGIAEAAREIETDAPRYLTPEFLTHVNELTLLIQSAGRTGIATQPKTTFSPLGPIPQSLPPLQDFRTLYKPRFLERSLGR